MVTSAGPRIQTRPSITKNARAAAAKSHLHRSTTGHLAAISDTPGLRYSGEPEIF
jgi:hypothetical protein